MNMKKPKADRKYMLVTKNGLHEYDVVVSDTDRGKRFDLHRSSNSEWKDPGGLIMTLEEDEYDGTVILPKMQRKIDVADAQELGILLKFAQLHGQEQFINDITFDAFEAGSGCYIL